MSSSASRAKVAAAPSAGSPATSRAGTAAYDNCPLPADVARPLSPALAETMGQRFRADFSGVRVHQGTQAQAFSEALDARAYTVGEDVVLGRNAPPLSSEAGRRTLAHELAHVVQQRRGGPPPTLATDAPHEAAADRAASAAMAGSAPVSVSGGTGIGVARDADEDAIRKRNAAKSKLSGVDPAIDKDVESGFKEEKTPQPAPKSVKTRKVQTTQEAKDTRQNFNKVRDTHSERLGVDKGGQVHHGVEVQAMKRYPGAFTEAEINAPENMRGIRPELEGKRQLHNRAIRAAWDRHYNLLDAQIKSRGLKKGTPEYRQYARKYLLEARAEMDYLYGGMYSEAHKEAAAKSGKPAKPATKAPGTSKKAPAKGDVSKPSKPAKKPAAKKDSAAPSKAPAKSKPAGSQPKAKSPKPGAKPADSKPKAAAATPKPASKAGPAKKLPAAAAAAAPKPAPPKKSPAKAPAAAPAKAPAAAPAKAPAAAPEKAPAAAPAKAPAAAPAKAPAAAPAKAPAVAPPKAPAAAPAKAPAVVPAKAPAAAGAKSPPPASAGTPRTGVADNRVPSGPPPSAGAAKMQAAAGALQLAGQGLAAIGDYVQGKAAQEAYQSMLPTIQAMQNSTDEGVWVHYVFSQRAAHPDSAINPGATFSHIELQVGTKADKRTPAVLTEGGSSGRVSSTWLPPGQRSLKSELAEKFERLHVMKSWGEREVKRTFVGRFLLERKGDSLDIAPIYEARAHLVSAKIALEQKRPLDAEKSMAAADALLDEMSDRIKAYMGPEH